MADLKAAQAQLFQLKQTEMAYQKHFFENSFKILKILEDKKRDFVLENLTQIDSCVSGLNLDVAAFKNIRNRLFVQIQDEIKENESSPRQKMYLYLFHLFESVVSHSAQLV